jgi:hypothetical protein
MKDFHKGRRQLAVLWLIFILVIYVFLFIQTLNGKYGSSVNEIWAWGLQNTLPTASLIVGAFVVSAFEKEENTKLVNTFIFRLSYGVSLFYLILLLSILLFQPVSGRTLFELTKESGLYLAPIQGLATAAIGVFFVKTKNKSS